MMKSWILLLLVVVVSYLGTKFIERLSLLRMSGNMNSVLYDS